KWVNTGSGAATDDFLYTYDRDGNRLTLTNGLNSSFSQQFSYDNLNRLSSFTQGSTTESWTLDAVGNWSSFTNGGTTQTRSFNNQNQITAISGATTPGYDNNGNTTTDQNGHTGTFDAWNRLVKVAIGSNQEVFTYDALHRRISQTVNTNSPTDFYYSAQG